MPRRKQPPTLRASSLRVVAKLVVDSCRKSDGKQQEEIRRYVQDIPIMFANEYVGEVLNMCSKRNDRFDFTSAFHPKCTVISKKSSDAFRTWLAPILHGLHIMKDLIIIEPAVLLRLPWEEEWQSIQFPKMSNLCSIKVSLGTNLHFLPQVIENCQRLEDIVIFDHVRLGEYRPTPSMLMLFSKCKHLRIIKVRSMTPEVAIHLLDHLPNLEVLLIVNILEVLPLCKQAYKLKDFVYDLKVHEAASVQKVVTHFPDLEKLSLLTNDNVNVNMISELDNLKSLTIRKGNSLNLLFLMDKCMFGLQELRLEEITGLDSLFKQNMNVSYPNLTALSVDHCTAVDVAGIRELFPNLTSLGLHYDDNYIAHFLPCKMPHGGFQVLEHLSITNVPIQQVRYLIPFCSKLKRLNVDNVSVKSCVYELLCNANLKELCTLNVEDNSMKREVIQIILDSCGEYLERVYLRSSELILSPDHVHELSNQLRQYDMHFCISNFFKHDPDNADSNGN